jgi:ABC-type phosphate transport system substrate-binding protein
MKRLIYYVAFSIATWSANPVHAGEFAVIVNIANPSAVDKLDVAKIYTGEKKRWDDGTEITAADLPEDNAVRVAFYTEILHKTQANFKVLWSRLIFTGRGLPPKVLASDDEVKRFVSGHTGAIGYLRASAVDASVKVVIE